ncbi:MAG: metallopeptidase family protein [Patescibacteria group bacterium]
MTHSEFEKLVREGFLLLPEKFRAQIKNVALLIEDKPSEDIRKKEELEKDETLLGLYQGIPNTARGDTYGVGPTLPDTITLYRVPIEEAALLRTRLRKGTAREEGKEIREVIAETIWHEYAHHFGMEEDEVRFREATRNQGNSRS